MSIANTKIMATKSKVKKEKDVVSDKATLVKDLAEELLSLMSLKSTVSVYEDKENEAIRIDIDAGGEAGLIIGNRGKTLQAIQSLLGIILKRRTQVWTRVIVNVSDWREKEEERLNKLALQVAQRAKETGEPQQLYNLTSSQRRIIHLTLSGDSEVKTESVGEGIDRCLVISSNK